jgi:hypothetical protein
VQQTVAAVIAAVMGGYLSFSARPITGVVVPMDRFNAPPSPPNR